MVQTIGFELGPMHPMHWTSWYGNTCHYLNGYHWTMDPNNVLKWVMGELHLLSKFCLENAFIIIIIFSLF